MATLLVLTVAAYGRHGALSVAEFVGLIAAVSQVTTGLGLVSPALIQLADVPPLYDAAAPVLHTALRATVENADPACCTGGSS